MTCLSRWWRWKSRTPKKARPGSAARSKVSTATGAATARRWSRRSARVTDYRTGDRGAHARNREQNFALNLLDAAAALFNKRIKMKTPLTRAGSKLVILGNIARIDTPRLTNAHARPILSGL